MTGSGYFMWGEKRFVLKDKLAMELRWGSILPNTGVMFELTKVNKGV